MHIRAQFKGLRSGWDQVGVGYGVLSGRRVFRYW